MAITIPGAGPHDGAPQIDVDALHARLAAGEPAQVVDVREDWEWAQGHIGQATHIPLGELPRRLGELDPSRPIVFICHLGGRSDMAARFAQQHGRSDVVSATGGMEAWEGKAYEVTSDQ